MKIIYFRHKFILKKIRKSFALMRNGKVFLIGITLGTKIRIFGLESIILYGLRYVEFFKKNSKNCRNKQSLKLQLSLKTFLIQNLWVLLDQIFELSLLSIFYLQMLVTIYWSLSFKSPIVWGPYFPLDMDF